MFRRQFLKLCSVIFPSWFLFNKTDTNPSPWDTDILTNLWKKSLHEVLKIKSLDSQNIKTDLEISKRSIEDQFKDPTYYLIDKNDKYKTNSYPVWFNGKVHFDDYCKFEMTVAIRKTDNPHNPTLLFIFTIYKKLDGKWWEESCLLESPMEESNPHEIFNKFILELQQSTLIKKD